MKTKDNKWDQFYVFLYYYKLITTTRKKKKKNEKKNEFEIIYFDIVIFICIIFNE